MANEFVLNLSQENFEVEVLSSDMPVLVDFWAPWCGPCRMLGPVIEELAEEYAGRAKVCKVNVDDEMELASKFGVTSIPSLFVVKNGEITASKIGFAPKDAILSMLN